MRRKTCKSLYSFSAVIALFLSWSFSTAALPPEVQADHPSSNEQSVHILQEDASLRGEYEKHFQNTDGSYTAVSYTEPVHMRRNEDWVEIDNTLTETMTSDGVRRFETRDGLMDVRFSDGTSDALVSVEKDGYAVSWSVEAAAPATEGLADAASPASRRSNAAPQPEMVILDTRNARAKCLAADIQELTADEIQMTAPKAGSQLEYPNAFGEAADVNLRYSVTPTSVKEDIVLEEFGGIASYTMVLTVTGLTAQLQEDNSVLFQNSAGDPVFFIPAPYMYDAADELSGQVDVTLSEAGGMYRYTLTPDPVWLSSEDRVYPVTIDPTIMFAYSTDVQQQIIDTYVNQNNNYEGYTNVHNLYKMTIGYRNGINHAFVRHTNMPAITGLIIGATEKFYLASGTSTAQKISAWKVNSTWESNAITWSNQPTGLTLLESNISPTGTSYYSVNILSAVQAWYAGSSGTVSNYGIMLRCTSHDDGVQNAGDPNDFNVLYTGDYQTAAMRPQITITYWKADFNLTDGVYYLRIEYDGRYMDSANSGGSGTSTLRWSYGGAKNQQWILARSSAVGYYQIAPRYNSNLRLTSAGDYDSADVFVSNYAGSSNAQRFMFVPFSGRYFLVPANTRTRVVDGLGSNQNVHMWTYGSTFTQQRWYLERAATVGNRGSYQNVTTSAIHCYAYALRIDTEGLNVDGYHLGDSVDTTRDKVLTQVRNMGRHIRVLDGVDDYVHSTNEYKVAMRTRPDTWLQIGDYHFMYQLSDGTWAHKQGDMSSVNLGAINPTTYDWGSYNSATVYFAISVP